MDERRSSLIDPVDNFSPVKAVVYDSFEEQWLCFENPIEFFICHDHETLPDILAHVEHKTQAGFYAVGFLSYEAAPAFDPAFLVKSSTDFPLAVLAIFKHPRVIYPQSMQNKNLRLSEHKRSIHEKQFASDVLAIKKHIARGDSYQVNYTHRLFFEFSGDALALFWTLVSDFQPAYNAFLTWQNTAVCSLSPELFFKLEGDRIICKPMKGTRPRGRFWQEDAQLREELFASAKDRAENVMIVDMIRNDLGRIADTGTVQVEKLYEVEKYPTVWQMTSTVSATTHADVPAVLRALFPCASITGAPKIRTMQIIQELETTPRKIYTGALGLLKPNRRYQFNVAIRTLLVDEQKQTCEYGVGSGIVWDSHSEGEWRECQVKSRVLQRRQPHFDLLETMLVEPERGIFLLEYHLTRLRHSADYFDYPFDADSIKRALVQIEHQNKRQKIRLLLSRTGLYKIELSNCPEPNKEPVRLTLAASYIDSQDIFLFHKTTHRIIYDNARRASHGDDVVLWNEDGEITETTIYNIMLHIDGRLYTPPISCGLLAGTYRAWLLDRGEVQEKRLSRQELQACEAIYVTNAVQGKRKAVLLNE